MSVSIWRGVQGRRRSWWTAVAIALSLSLVAGTTPLIAQRGAATARVQETAAGLRAVDAWIVTRFRGAQLLQDSTMRELPSDRRADLPVPPRVESMRESAAGDTLFALHFGADGESNPLRESITVRLGAPSGAITNHEARVLARRAFRAPRLPNARPNSSAGWRYGWAYVLVTRSRRPSPGFRGWLVLPRSDSAAAGYVSR